MMLLLGTGAKCDKIEGEEGLTCALLQPFCRLVSMACSAEAVQVPLIARNGVLQVKHTFSNKTYNCLCLSQQRMVTMQQAGHNMPGSSDMAE